MKKKSPPYAIILAVILGIVAVGAFFKFEKDQEAKHQADIDALNKAHQDELNAANSKAVVTVTPTDTHTRLVLYATQPVEPGVRISAAFFEKKLTPVDILPDAYSDGTDVVGWFATRRIEKGDPLTPRNVNKVLPTLASRIPLGMRAVSLPVFNAESNSTGGFVVDGDRVDLLWTNLTPDGGEKIDTRFLVQNLTVLYVPGPGPQFQSDTTQGLNPAPSPGGAVGVTFVVTPEQAQALVLLQSSKNGHFNMILRATRDNTEVNLKPFTAEKFYSNEKVVQKLSDTSLVRVQELAKEIEETEKKQGQGNTNETPTPTPPSP